MILRCAPRYRLFTFDHIVEIADLPAAEEDQLRSDGTSRHFLAVSRAHVRTLWNDDSFGGCCDQQSVETATCQRVLGISR